VQRNNIRISKYMTFIRIMRGYMLARWLVYVGLFTGELVDNADRQILCRMYRDGYTE
jgi:hypothetical protein